MEAMMEDPNINIIIIILFPGIMAGSNRSGDLADPQVSSQKYDLMINCDDCYDNYDDDNDENYNDRNVLTC